MTHSLFCDLKQRFFLIISNFSGQPVGPFFKSETVQGECDKNLVHSYVGNVDSGDWLLGRVKRAIWINVVK